MLNIVGFINTEEVDTNAVDWGSSLDTARRIWKMNHQGDTEDRLEIKRPDSKYAFYKIECCCESKERCGGHETFYAIAD
jgi:hypothetical protein